MNKTIYVRDEALWTALRRFARAQGRSISEVICDALRVHINPDRRSADPATIATELERVAALVREMKGGKAA